MDFGYYSKNGSVPDLSAMQNSGYVSVDLEASSADTPTAQLHGYALSTDTQSAYFTMPHNRFFEDILCNEDVTKIGHNLKFDRSVFKRYNITMDNLCDTIIAAHLLEEEKLALEALMWQYFWQSVEHKPWSLYKKSIPHSTPQELAEFFWTHSAGPLMLWMIYQRRLRAEGLWKCFWEVEMPLVPVLSDMESVGAYIDTKRLESLGEYYDGKIAILEDGLSHYAYKQAGVQGVNFNSSDQMADLFYNKLKLPKPPSWTYKGKRHPSVDKRYLEPFKGKIPIISLYLQYKAYKHLKSTYVTGILKRLVNNRIHTNFNQIRTRTGRLSSTDPNLQNIPQRSLEGKKIRSAFVATPDDNDRVIVKVDFDQMELRDVACWADCKPLIDAFNNGEDVHMKTAANVFGGPEYRPEAKTLHYQLVYGGGIEKHRNMFFSAYPEMERWTNRMYRQFEIFGYARTRHGRKRNLGDFEKMVGELAAHAKREGISTVVQGSCSEVMKIGMRKVWNEIKDSDIYMTLQVHDELQFDTPRKRLPELVDVLDRNLVYRELQVPLTISVSVGNNWAETINYEEYVQIGARRN